jgi:hypothetical protein
MSEPIRIDPQVMREVAAGHDDIAQIIDGARERGADIAAAVDSLGPIMHQVKAAVADLLVERDSALAEHASRHRAASDQLNRAAHLYVNMDDENTETIRDV